MPPLRGHWENPPGEPTPLLLFGWPDMEQERTRFGLEIPALGSLILTHSLDKQVPALKEFPKEDRPNSTIVFWSFRIMAGLGMLMLLLGVMALWLRYKKTRLFIPPVPVVCPVNGPIRADCDSGRLGHHRSGPPAVGGLWTPANEGCGISPRRSAYEREFAGLLRRLHLGVWRRLQLYGSPHQKGPQPHESFATASDGRPARPLSAVTTEHKEQP